LRSTPLAIVTGMPAAVAISAATTFERMPPEPSGDVDTPISKASSVSISRTSSTSRADGSWRGSAE
jgi:hypothetical protein